MGKNKFNEEQEFNEIISEENTSQVKQSKNIISRVVPNDIKIVSKNESQKNLIKSIKNNEITICAGPPGCGKTYVALAYALSLLRKPSNNYKNIFLVKSVTTLKNEDMGFLKGDVKEKLEPVMWSFYINMEKLILKTKIDELVESGIIRPYPLAYIKGASLDNCIIIADEFQNVTLDNSRTLMTRIGNNSKLIMLGDVNQIDLKNKDESSLEILLDMFNDVDGIGVVEMSKEDTNVRNPIITTIENKYEEYLQRQLEPKKVNEKKNNNRLKVG